jgi:cobalt-zinc-cadmium efflux system outer membrane protein
MEFQLRHVMKMIQIQIPFRTVTQIASTLLLIAGLLYPGAAPAQQEIHTIEHEDLFATDNVVSSESPMLDAYVRTALERSDALGAAFDNWQAALEDVPQVTALPNPMIEWTHFIEEVQTRTGAQNNRFMLSQQIPWKGKRAEAGKIAANHAESLWWVAVQLKLETIRAVKNVYYEYAYLGQAIRIVEENISLLHNLEPVVQGRVRGGASQGDILRLQVEIGKLENEVETLSRLRPALNAQLDAILNEPSAAPRPWPEIVPTEGQVFDTAKLKTVLDNTNPGLRQRDSQLRQADHHITRKKLDRKPDFSVGITYIDTGSISDTMPSADRGDDPFGVTVGMSIPIWRKKIDAGSRQAKHRESALRRTRHQERQNLHAELELQAYKLDDALRQIALYRDTLIPRGNQVTDIRQVEYQSGNASLLDVIDSERESLSFAKTYWRAVSDYGIRLADLEALCGGDI